MHKVLRRDENRKRNIKGEEKGRDSLKVDAFIRFPSRYNLQKWFKSLISASSPPITPRRGEKLGNIQFPSPPLPSPLPRNPATTTISRTATLSGLFALGPYLDQQTPWSGDCVDTCSLACLSPAVGVFKALSFLFTEPGMIRSLVYCTRDLIKGLFIAAFSTILPLKQFQCLSD